MACVQQPNIPKSLKTSIDISERQPWSATIHADTNDKTWRVGRRFFSHGGATTSALALTAAAVRARLAEVQS